MTIECGNVTTEIHITANNKTEISITPFKDIKTNKKIKINDKIVSGVSIFIN